MAARAPSRQANIRAVPCYGLEHETRNIEALLIIGAGLFMHMNNFSILELKYSDTEKLNPNIPSIMFVMSMLILMVKVRPIWHKLVSIPDRIAVFLVEFGTILFASEVIFRFLWLGLLDVLEAFCHFLGIYIEIANLDFANNYAPNISKWMREDAFYVVRFLAALWFFLLMTWVIKTVKPRLPRNVQRFQIEINNENVQVEEQRQRVLRPERIRPRRIDPGFDSQNLPLVPQEDLFNIGQRVGYRRNRSRAHSHNP